MCCSSVWQQGEARKTTSKEVSLQRPQTQTRTQTSNIEPADRPWDATAPLASIRRKSSTLLEQVVSTQSRSMGSQSQDSEGIPYRMVENPFQVYSVITQVSSPGNTGRNPEHNPEASSFCSSIISSPGEKRRMAPSVL